MYFLRPFRHPKFYLVDRFEHFFGIYYVFYGSDRYFCELNFGFNYLIFSNTAIHFNGPDGVWFNNSKEFIRGMNCF